MTDDYRQQLYDRLKADLAGAHLIIIGQSLADPDIRNVVDRALSLKASAGAVCRISLLMYTRNEGRAVVQENRGVDVAFGSIDDFFAGMVQHISDPGGAAVITGDPLDQVPALRPVTVDVIPIPVAQYRLAQSRIPIEMMCHG